MPALPRHDFQRQAELAKLARWLRTSTQDLAYLHTLDTATLQSLREACARQLLGENAGLFRRFASASKLLPGSVIGLIAERSLGPLLCARVAGEMPTERAVEISRHLKPEFMAATAIHLDPATASALTAALPFASILTVTRQLMAQGEYITLSDLVSLLPLPLIERILREIRHPAALLRTGFFISDEARLNAILERLPSDYLRDLIRAAADESQDLWPHALAMMSKVSRQWQTRLVHMAGEGDDAMLGSMVRGVMQHQLWDVALPLFALMPESQQRRILALPVLHNEAELRRLLQHAEQAQLWSSLLPLIPAMPESLRQLVSRLTDELSDATIQQLIASTHDLGLWAHGLLLFEFTAAPRRTALAELFAQSDDAVINSLLANVREQQRWHLLLTLLHDMHPDYQRRYLALAFFQDEKVLSALVQTCAQHDMWPALLELLAFMPTQSLLHIARLAEALDGDAIRRLTATLQTASQWLAALQLLSYMRPERRNLMTLQVLHHDDAGLNHILQSLHDHQAWLPLLTLLETLPDDVQYQWLERSLSLDATLRLALLQEAVTQHRCGPVLKHMATLAPAQRHPLQQLMRQLPATHFQQLQQHAQALGLDSLLS